jgi:hypothetical protein
VNQVRNLNIKRRTASKFSHVAILQYPTSRIGNQLTGGIYIHFISYSSGTHVILAIQKVDFSTERRPPPLIRQLALALPKRKTLHDLTEWVGDFFVVLNISGFENIWRSSVQVLNQIDWSGRISRNKKSEDRKVEYFQHFVLYSKNSKNSGLSGKTL